MRQRIKIGALAGLVLVGLVGTTLGATSPASAGDVPDPVITGSTKAGYLDRTFAGGAGYRSIPQPGDAVGGAGGLGLAVSSSGLIRTLTDHRIDAPFPIKKRVVLRSFTQNGWVDKGFLAGNARNMGTVGNFGAYGVIGLDFTATNKDSVSLWRIDGSSANQPITVQRIGRDGSLSLSERIGATDRNINSDVEILSSGGFISCSASEEFGLPATLDFYSASGQDTGSKTLTGSYRCFLQAAGSHLWAWDTESRQVARMSLAGVPDPQWGGDGFITATTSPAGGLVGRSDGSLYAMGKKKIGGSWRQGLARYAPSGALDPAFGSAGFVTIGGSGSILAGRTVTVRTWTVGPKGPVLSLDVSDPGVKNSTRYRLIRLTNAGALDQGFGRNGIVESSTPITALAHDAQGRILTLNRTATGTATLARRNG